MRNIFQNKIVKKILFYSAIFVVVAYTVFGLTTLLIIVDTGHELDTTVYHRQALTFIDNEDLDKLHEDYGEENVTRVNRYLDWAVQYVYFVDNTFINTGMTAYNHSYDRDIVEDINLIDGEVWEKGSTEKVIIIDERAAEWLHLEVGDSYRFFGDSESIFEVVGIVENLSYPGTKRGQDDPLYEFFKEDPSTLPRVLYIPYGLTEILEEYEHETVDTVIVKSDNVFKVKSDSDDFGSYLQDKMLIDGVQTWSNHSGNVINLSTIREDDTVDIGYTFLVLIAYGFTVVFIQLGKRYKQKNKTIKETLNN